jgi:hypothetical protein
MSGDAVVPVSAWQRQACCELAFGSVAGEPAIK